jgi:hypothetical protein
MLPFLALTLLALLAIAYAAYRTLEFIRRLDADLDTPLPLAFEDPNSIKPVSVRHAGKARKRAQAVSGIAVVAAGCRRGHTPPPLLRCFSKNTLNRSATASRKKKHNSPQTHRSPAPRS